MFRTVILRSDVAREILRKSLRSKSFRNVSIECGKRRHYHRSLFGPQHSKILQNLITSEQNFVRYYASNLPSHTRVTLPALSPTMELGTIVSWDKKEGDKLNEGDLLAEIETDKATMGFETPEEGYLAKILIPAGTKDVPIGKLVCIIVENESDIAAFKDFKDDGGSAPQPAPAAAPTAPAPTPAPVAPSPAAPSAAMHAPATVPAVPEPSATGRVYVSPMAKRLAEQRNIRLQGKGSGLFGAITSSDLGSLETAQALSPAAGQKGQLPAAAAPSTGSFQDIPLTGMRTTIAKRLLQSKQTIPHYYLSVEININKLMTTRAEFNKKLEKEGVKLSVNDFIIKAVAQASLKVPEANSSWNETSIRQYRNVDVSVAVSTDKGLITPIIFEAERKGLAEISKTMKGLAAKARDGKLQPQEFQGGTISISNLGMMGIDQFCAVINPPQSCILAIGSATNRLIEDASSDKGFKSAQFLQVTLSCDHRVVDGAVGARWLQAFKQYLEDPVSMIM
ncbi:unnamed protein product [Psylliodes chrysocephalus]|uniref:dihydrolipoyllysine-residue acetyltransferase n=1 Tax=Psylliodes chrysocephalus TaxID=3402493 RepID=A0A9P0D801_9CUCU|nr:unnamed protein product [Psylliodes chrysocephala]